MKPKISKKQTKKISIIILMFMSFIIHANNKVKAINDTGSTFWDLLLTLAVMLSWVPVIYLISWWRKNKEYKRDKLDSVKREQEYKSNRERRIKAKEKRLKKQNEELRRKRRQFEKEQEQAENKQKSQSHSNQESLNPNNLNDAYEILGCDLNDNLATFKKAYRYLRAMYHPDKMEQFGGRRKRQAEEEMKLINQAWARVQKEF